jgi:preprotein translocase subunit SecA
VPEALVDSEGPWKLLAWLEQIQPSLPIGSLVYPSYMIKLLAEQALGGRPSISKGEAISALVEIAAGSLESEEGHLLRAVDSLMVQSQERLKIQLKERLEAIDTFFEGLELEEEGEPRSPRQLLDELTAAARMPLKLSPEQQKALRLDPGRETKGNNSLDDLVDEVHAQVETQISIQAITRLLGSIERRLENSLELNPASLAEMDWKQIEDSIIEAVEAFNLRRRDKLVGSDGQIHRDLDSLLARADGQLNANSLYQLLLILPQGARAAFDRKTHRRVLVRTTRLNYVYYAGHLLQGRETDEITQDVLAHLQKAKTILQQAWGAAEWTRLAASSIGDLDNAAQKAISGALGDEAYLSAAAQPLGTLEPGARGEVIEALGNRALTEIYRQLLLAVITELWVDYLTQMEALRVSIGLEAYAQRDPLVQYKNRAFALFQELLSNMRLGVISRMFTYRPRDISSVQTGVTRSEEMVPGEADIDSTEVERLDEEPENGEAESGDEDGLEAESEPVAAMDRSPANAASNPMSRSKKRRRRRK